MGEGTISEQTRQLLDAEVLRITDECHTRALRILREYREQLDALARALLDHETLDGPTRRLRRRGNPECQQYRHLSP